MVQSLYLFIFLLFFSVKILNQICSYFKIKISNLIEILIEMKSICEKSGKEPFRFKKMF